MTLEERILRMIPVLDLPSDRNELRAIALEVRKIEDRIKHLEDSLRRIANTDYRGNRSTESQIAFRALEAKP